MFCSLASSIVLCLVPGPSKSEMIYYNFYENNNERKTKKNWGKKKFTGSRFVSRQPTEYIYLLICCCCCWVLFGAAAKNIGLIGMLKFLCANGARTTPPTNNNNFIIERNHVDTERGPCARCTRYRSLHFISFSVKVHK